MRALLYNKQEFFKFNDFQFYFEYKYKRSPAYVLILLNVILASTLGDSSTVYNSVILTMWHLIFIINSHRYITYINHNTKRWKNRLKVALFKWHWLLYTVEESPKITFSNIST